jgi:hypothetical protein
MYSINHYIYNFVTEQLHHIRSNNYGEVDRHTIYRQLFTSHCTTKQHPYNEIYGIYENVYNLLSNILGNEKEQCRHPVGHHTVRQA